MPYCKECLKKIDVLNFDNFIDLLRKIDVPYIKNTWDNVTSKYSENQLGNYLKIIAMQQKGKTFKDSDNIGIDKIDKLNNIISSKENKIENLDNIIEDKKENLNDLKQKEKIDLHKMEEKWGSGFTSQNYRDFEDKYNALYDTLPNKTDLHLEPFKKYIIYSTKEIEAIANNNPSDAKLWGELAQKVAKQGKITPEQLTVADLSQGIDDFASLVREVEKAVDIIPILPEFIERPKDKVDMVIYHYINYARKLHGLPTVEYKDVYDFYNKMIEDAFQDKPEEYKFITESGVDGNTPIEKVYNYVFNVVIPQKKKEYPNEKFYQNLDKWVKWVSFYRWNIDLFYDLITPKNSDGSKKGIRLGIDQRATLRAMNRFQEMHTVLSRGSGKCVVGDTLLFTDKGIKEIGSFFNYQKDNIETVSSLNYSILNKDGEKEKIFNGIYNGIKDTKKIITELGYMIEGTVNHPLMTININGEYVFKEIQDFKIGNYLLINKNNNLFGTENKKIKIKDLQNIDDLSFIFNINKKQIEKFLYKFINNNKIINLKEKVSKQLQIILLNLGTICNRIRNKNTNKYDLIILDKHQYYENNDYIFVPIKEIIDSKNHTYDIYMPKTNSFIGNGIVNHNTFLNQMYFIAISILYPDINVSLSAQTSRNSSSLITEKFNEIMKFYPLISTEYYPAPKSRFSTEKTEIRFKTGSKIDNLANQQSSKGQRRNRMIIEESAQVNEVTFYDALAPIVTEPRKTIGNARINPIELNGQIIFFTTSWYRGTSEYERAIKMYDNMINLKGSYVIGSSYELNIFMERGSNKNKILKEKEKSITFFKLNYESEWIGAGEGALISIDKLMELRTIQEPEFENKSGNDEYIIGVDVARSNKHNNNKSAIHIGKIKRRKNNSIENVSIVNLFSLSGTLSFEDLSIEIKRLKKKFQAKMIVIDGNGLGVGLTDALSKEQFDPITNESLGAFKPINEDLQSADPYAEPMVYVLKAQSHNTQIIINFQTYVETGKLRLLTKSDFLAQSDIYSIEELEKEMRPFVETDLLLDEIANLKLKINDNKKYEVERMSVGIDKDRYSALIYLLYYIKNYEDVGDVREVSLDADDYFFFN